MLPGHLFPLLLGCGTKRRAEDSPGLGILDVRSPGSLVTVFRSSAGRRVRGRGLPGGAHGLSGEELASPSYHVLFAWGGQGRRRAARARQHGRASLCASPSPMCSFHGETGHGGRLLEQGSIMAAQLFNKSLSSVLCHARIGHCAVWSKPLPAHSEACLGLGEVRVNHFRAQWLQKAMHHRCKIRHLPLETDVLHECFF